MGRGFYGGGDPEKDPHLSVGDKRKPTGEEYWHEQPVDWYRHHPEDDPNRQKKRWPPKWWPFRRNRQPRV